MQHINLELQREAKQKALFHRLQKLQDTPIDFQPMIVGSDKYYRRRARLSIAQQKNEWVMGFRLQNSNQIIPLDRCEIGKTKNCLGILSSCLLIMALQCFYAT